MTGKTLTIVSCALVCLSWWPGTVMADRQRAPYSYTRESPDGEYVFVMLSPVFGSDEAKYGSDPESLEIQRIRQMYTESGLYRNDGSTEPLWTVSWYSYRVEVLPDGVHLVRPGPWASDPSDDAVAFFANGKLLKSYAISDLVARPDRMPHSVSHFMWRRGERLVPETREYEILTLHDEYYRFDVTTGEIIEQRTPTRLDRKSLVVGAALMLVGLIVVMWFVCRPDEGN